MNRQQVDSLDGELTQVLGARPRDAAGCIPVLERAVALCRTDPAAAQAWVEVELLEELVDCYETVGRVDDAITTMRWALEVGWHGEPDGRCRIAELLMRDGRVEQAAPIWQQVLADTPDDVWLYNNAGLEYAAIGDHREALTWLTRRAAAGDRHPRPRPAGRSTGRSAGRVADRAGAPSGRAAGGRGRVPGGPAAPTRPVPCPGRHHHPPIG